MPGTSHQPDERLELYALGRLPEPEVAVIEEHLLVCGACQERLDEVEMFAVAMHRAIATEPAAPEAKERNMWFGWLLRPRPELMAVGFAAIMLTAILYLHPGRNVPAVASVDLAAMRGETQQVPPAQETDIILTDAPNKVDLRVEVIDSTGERIWIERLRAPRERVKIAKPLPPGSYFVRLIDPSGQLLHEYGFNVRVATL